MSEHRCASGNVTVFAVCTRGRVCAPRHSTYCWCRIYTVPCELLEQHAGVTKKNVCLSACLSVCFSRSPASYRIALRLSVFSQEVLPVKLPRCCVRTLCDFWFTGSTSREPTTPAPETTARETLGLPCTVRAQSGALLSWKRLSMMRWRNLAIHQPHPTSTSSAASAPDSAVPSGQSHACSQSANSC